MKVRCALVLCVQILLAGCVGRDLPPGSAALNSTERTGYFVMPDGTSLPYREWAPKGDPVAVVLALHGMNDSRDAWEYPAPAFAADGIAVFSPDQRGFGSTPARGRWPGTAVMTDDARVMARLLRVRYPDTRLVLMGESMGAAALMVMATEPDPPPVDGYVLIAPAVWARSEMNPLMRITLWLANKTVPSLTLSGGGFVKVTATDNRDALIRLSSDPLTIHETRVDAIKGLVDLMDQAQASAPRFDAPALVMYGGRDELVPPRATAAMWRALPRGPVTAFYPNGYHLLLRDKDRALPIGDILGWIRDPRAPLPSGADRAAQDWLHQQDQS